MARYLRPGPEHGVRHRAHRLPAPKGHRGQVVRASDLTHRPLGPLCNPGETLLSQRTPSLRAILTAHGRGGDACVGGVSARHPAATPKWWPRPLWWPRPSLLFGSHGATSVTTFGLTESSRRTGRQLLRIDVYYFRLSVQLAPWVWKSLHVQLNQNRCCYFQHSPVVEIF